MPASARKAEENKKEARLKTCAQLCRALRESGTGVDKLNILRELLKKNPNATAEEGYKVLYDHPHVVQRTIDKARGLIDDGVVPPADLVTFTVPIEDKILGVTAPATAGGQVSEGELQMRERIEKEYAARLNAEAANMRKQVREETEAAVRAEAERAANEAKAAADKAAKDAADKAAADAAKQPKTKTDK